MNVEQICKISSNIWATKEQWTSLLRECYEHALSDRNPYFSNGSGLPGGAGTQGQDKTSKRVFDSTLAADAVQLANKLQYELFPIGSKWAEFIPGPFVQTQESDQMRQNLEALRETVFTAIALSNFDLAIAEWLLELVVAGTACMLVQGTDDPDNPIVYQCVTQAHVAFREGALGTIDFISRKSRMRHSLIAQTWPGAKAPVLVDKDKDDPEIDLIDVCYWDHAEKVWQYKVISTNVGKDKQNSEVFKTTYVTNPWIIARWSKAAGEVQGRGLVMLALPDARVLSSVKSYLLRNAALAVGGAFLVKDGGGMNANNVRIYPGALIPVRSTGGTNGASIAPLQVGGDINLAQLIIEDLINSIHKIMLNDGMPEIKDGIRSATEVIERLKRLQQSLGAPFSRVLKEGIIPILEATISTLHRTGVIQLGESSKIKLNNGRVSVRFTSPVVQGQQLRDVETALQAVGMTQQATGGQQELLAVAYKVEDIGAWIGNKLGVDPALIRTAAERQQLQQQAGQMAGMQMGGVMPGAQIQPGQMPDETAMAA